ncbi:MAG: DUF2066 domain-containing protein [Pseudomonadales bacterium]
MSTVFERVFPGITLAFAIMLCATSQWAVAAVGADMYKSTVAVESQSMDDREDGIKLGLGTVIVRLSGQRSAVSEPEIQRALKTADRYLRSFSYQRKSEDRLSLLLQFDPELVQGLLRRAELPMWVSGRPTVLLWVAVHEGRKKFILSPDTDPEISQLLEEQMARRGVPVRWPDQRTELQVEALRLLEIDAIRDASARYSEPAIFASSIYIRKKVESGETISQWAGRCLYISQTDQQRLNCRSGDSETYLSSSVDSLADVLSDRYSVQIQGGEASQVRIQVGDIDDFDSYGRTLKHLQSNALVRAAKVVEIAPGRAVFELELQGTEQQFIESLARQQVLQRAVGGDEYGPLQYLFNKRGG